MKRLSDTILTLALDNCLSPVERSEQIQAALGVASKELTNEIALAIAMSFYDSSTGIEIAKAQIKRILEERL